MGDDELAVLGAHDVVLDVVGPLAQRQPDRRQGVLGGHRRRAAVTDHGHVRWRGGRRSACGDGDGEGHDEGDQGERSASTTTPLRRRASGSRCRGRRACTRSRCRAARRPRCAGRPRSRRRTRRGRSEGRATVPASTVGRCRRVPRAPMISRWRAGCGLARFTGPVTSGRASRCRIAPTSSARVIQGQNWRPSPTDRPASPKRASRSSGAIAPPWRASTMPDRTKATEAPASTAGVAGGLPGLARHRENSRGPVDWTR